MKKSFFISSFISLLYLLVSSCSDTDQMMSDSSEYVRSVKVSCEDPQFEEGAITRTSYTSNLSFSWSLGDTLGIYPVGADQVSFPISSGAGSNSANFDGGAWALRSTFRYSGYFPFSANNYHNSMEAIPVSYIGQEQDGNNSMTNLGRYDFMSAAPTTPSASGSVDLQMKRLGCFMRLALTIPEACTLANIKIESDGVQFGTKGTINLTATTPSLTVTERSSSVSMILRNVTTTAANQSVVLWMLAAPADLSSSTLTISATTNAGETVEGTVQGKNMSANGGYGYSVTLSKKGTGATGEDPKVDFEDETNMINGHEYVDLGLPSGLLWATCNIGAENPEDYGYYFAWGETTGYSYTEHFYWDNYQWCNGAYNSLTKYNTQSNYGLVDNKTELETEDDAANAYWKGTWRIPTKVDFQELYDNCTWEWISKEGVFGYKISNNGKSIFLPAACKAGYPNDPQYGCYWSASLNTTFPNSNNPDPSNAYFLTFGSDYIYCNAIGLMRCEGGTIRPVAVEAKTNTNNGHEYVDLGVVVDGKPVYWATTNIGAEQPADYGLYFAWGETVGYTEDSNDGRKFDWASYSSKLCGGESHKMKKYCTDSNYGIVDYKTVLDPEDDAAHVNWQGAWRMPTKEEQDALRTQCTWTWTTMTNSLGKSVNGYKVSNKTDSSKYIFLPAAGNRFIDFLSAAGSGGDCWSSSLGSPLFGTRECDYAFFFHFDSDGYAWGGGYRSYGRSVRPVCQ